MAFVLSGKALRCARTLLRRFFTLDVMSTGAAACRQSPLDSLPFDNVALRRLPVEDSLEPGVRTVRGACFSRVQPQPLTAPRIVALSAPALALLGARAEQLEQDPHTTAAYLSGSRTIPGSEPAAHCYCGHQFGQFAGQLGDGAACYLGEVKAPAEQRRGTPSGRWEIQLKGAGLTPYSRQADGRKVLRSSIREFLCSEAMFALGIPTTRAASVVTSDLYVLRDIFYNGQPKKERCTVVMRIAPTFIRFGSFEIFNPADELTGRQGPSLGRDDLKAQLLDYVIETLYPDIQQRYSDRVERNVAFFKEVMVRTANLVAQWQCVGFCHGVLNTDNMSILALTIDYGPFGFMDRFDPDFVCNASDNMGRYSYQAQPAVCHWNLARLAEALEPELPADHARAVLGEYQTLYNTFYLAIMRRKLGLLRREEAQDEELVTQLLQTMHNTGADFTNTFRSLSRVPCPTRGEDESDGMQAAVDLLMEQCATLEDLKEANRPTMDPRELAMLLSLAQSNPGIFQLLAGKKSVSKQLERLERLHELLETTQEDLHNKHREEWAQWVTKYRKRLAEECSDESDLQTFQDERVQVMDSTNPRVVLRNYIAQNAIEAAENGDFSEVQRVLNVLEKPYSAQPVLEQPGWVGGGRAEERDEQGVEEQEAGALSRPCVPYDGKPPEWAGKLCVT